MRTLALTIAYDGTDYMGFQRQPGLPSIQGTLEEALTTVFQHPVQVVAAGRTDAGVHAFGQMVSFRTASTIPIDRVAWVTNRYLPPTIRVRHAVERESTFHARFSAAYRRYWYVVQTAGKPDPVNGRFRWQLLCPLDMPAMSDALATVQGTHDFDAFCHRSTPGGSTVRTLHRILVRQWRDGIIIDVQAEAFLHQMVRLLVANTVLIGCGKRPVSWLAELLESRNRHLAGVAAPSCGLFLMRIGYPPTVNPRWGSILEKMNNEELLG